MRLKFNRENWSGEEATINVRQSDNSFEMYDYRWTLVPNEKLTVDHGTFGFEVFNVISTDFNREFPVICVVQRYRHTDDKWDTWEAFDEDNHPHNGGISRSNANKFVAVAQYLSNAI
jgi:hypothetical protein